MSQVCDEIFIDVHKFLRMKVPLVLCYEEEGLVGMALLLLIRKYIQCSKLSVIMADVLSGRTSKATSCLFPLQDQAIQTAFFEESL